MPSYLVTENQNSEGEDIPARVGKSVVGTKRKSKATRSRKKAAKRVKRATGTSAVEGDASHDSDYTTDSGVSDGSSESNQDEILSNAEVCSQI